MKNQDIHPLDIRLSPHQTRLVVERNSLATRLKDLQKFIAVSPEFPLLPHDERNLMLDQRDTMGRYLLILNQRIERIERIDLPAKAGNKTETPAPQPEPVMGPRLKDVTKECGCFYCRLSRQIQKEDEQREKAGDYIVEIEYGEEEMSFRAGTDGESHGQDDDGTIFDMTTTDHVQWWCAGELYTRLQKAKRRLADLEANALDHPRNGA